MNGRLSTAYRAFDKWCTMHGIAYDILVDEDDIQAYLVPKKYANALPALSVCMDRLGLREGLHCAKRDIRAGTVFAMSLAAINEGLLDGLTVGENDRLLRHLDLAYGGIDECNTACRARRRSSKPSRNIDRRLKESLGYLPVRAVVAEALDGIAADYQPMDVLRQFESALKDLGLLSGLKNAGVTNKLSADKQIIHFYVPDADGRDREVAGYELTKLAEGNNMETAIKDLIDIARRRAPGTSDREADRIKEREAAIRNVAKQHSLDSDVEDDVGGRQQVASAINSNAD